jgi:hypothetical protein
MRLGEFRWLVLPLLLAACADSGSGGSGGSGSGAAGEGGSGCENAAPTTEAKATSEPFTEEPTCDPIGVWQLAFEPSWSGQPTTIEIGFDANSALVVRSDYINDASISANGCDLTLSWKREDWGLEGGECFGCIRDTEATLVLEPTSDQATGSYQHSEAGDCGKEESGTVTATRTPR